jgi:hypothetical protein
MFTIVKLRLIVSLAHGLLDRDKAVYDINGHFNLSYQKQSTIMWKRKPSY